jgi:hypothetical protein
MACGTLTRGSGSIATTVAEVQQGATAVSEIEELATAVGESFEEETATPLPLPGPEVKFTRKFHYASLDLSLLGWQMIGETTPEGISCESFMNVHLAMRVQIVNAADKAYTLYSNALQVVDANNQPASFLWEGAVFPASTGLSGDLEVPGKGEVEEVLCTDISPDVDPASLTLVLGDANHVQVRVPLSPEGSEDLGGSIEAPLNQTISFKGAEISLPKVIVTTGVWTKTGIEGQAETGKRWLVIPTQVNNTGNPNLFIEDNEITLKIDDQVLGRELTFYEAYQAAPTGLAQGLTAQGALLFQIPEGTRLMCSYRSICPPRSRSPEDQAPQGQPSMKGFIMTSH